MFFILVKTAALCYKREIKYKCTPVTDRSGFILDKNMKKKDEKLSYYLIEASAVPKVYKKIIETKELIARDPGISIAEAVSRVGLSRSTYYKYKDSISLFRDVDIKRPVTIHAKLVDNKGVLSGLLQLVSELGASVITINQSIPTDGIALLTLSISTQNLSVSIEELVERAIEAEGVNSFEILQG